MCRQTMLGRQARWQSASLGERQLCSFDEGDYQELRIPCGEKFERLRLLPITHLFLSGTMFYGCEKK